MMKVSESIKYDLKTPPPIPVDFFFNEQDAIWISFVSFCQENAKNEVQCCITLESHSRVNCISCKNGHFVSQEAFQSLVVYEADKDFDEIAKNKGCLKCPACDSHYRDRDVALMCRNDIYEKYQSMKSRFIYQQAFEKIADDMEKSSVKEKRWTHRRLMREAVRNQFKKADETFTGFACPRCHFGPVDKKACDDMVAHHGQKIKGHIKISNACPQCFWFGKNSNEWKKWDGTFLDDERQDRVEETLNAIKEPYWKITDEIRDTLALLSKEKDELNRLNGHVKHRALLDSISGPSRSRELDDISEEEAERQLKEIEDPMVLRLQLANASGAEFQDLSKRFMIALHKRKTLTSKTKGAKRMLEICVESKKLSIQLANKTKQMEEAVVKSIESLEL